MKVEIMPKILITQLSDSDLVTPCKIWQRMLASFVVVGIIKTHIETKKFPFREYFNISTLNNKQGKRFILLAIMNDIINESNPS